MDQQPRSFEIIGTCKVTIVKPGPGFKGVLHPLSEDYIAAADKLDGLSFKQNGNAWVDALEDMISLKHALEITRDVEGAIFSVTYNCHKE